jgi:S-adenosylmethionine:tRNA ribosyltransferase-isomerase
MEQDEDLLLSSYDYQLPETAIAQTPAVPRDSSRLLVVTSPTAQVHAAFHQLPDWLLPGDLLILNNTRVIPARLFGRKETGSPVEVLLLEERENNCWLALVKPGRRFKQGTTIIFQPVSPQARESSLTATVIARDEATSGRLLQFHLSPGTDFWTLLEQFGQIPFPPYVTASEADPSQYQTVYAQELGAVAAPTAGLHFTPELLQRLSDKGVAQAEITLHVGVGTFRPVEAADITTHTMHQEWVEVPASTVAQIAATKARGGRVIAVGTTVVRALEGAAKEAKTSEGNLLAPFRGKTDIFIYPGYQWQVIDGLITNFHLPRSSLLMLVSALIGRKRLLSLYEEAITEGYRFYSFGDAMLILPQAQVS